MAERRIVHVLVRGRVQGVGFRAWAQQEAERHGLGGWVRNRRDGAVEAVLAGPVEAVEAVLAACRCGPSFARVEEVVAREADAAALAERGAAGFPVLPTVG